MVKNQGNKINILFAIVQIDIMGGSERLVYNLAANLDRTLFNPSIAWFYGQDKTADFKKLGIPLFHLPKVKRVDLSTMRRFGQMVRENNIQIVNAHHFMSMVYAFYGCTVKNRARLVYTEHSEWELERLSWKWRTAGRYLLNRADAAIGVSAAVSEQIRNTFKIDKSKNVTILNGVDLRSMAADRDSGMVRKELGIAPTEKVISIVANLKKVKNHIFLLKAFAEIVKRHKNIRLLIIGQGCEGDPENTEQELRNFIRARALNESVLFLGYRQDIPRLLNASDIFCLTSVKEGLPISLIEAMAAGLPVVGTEVEGIRDVIISGKNGFLVPIGDVRGLEDALSALISDPALREEFGRESKKLAGRNYSLDSCVQKYGNLFTSVLNRHDRRHDLNPYANTI